MLAHERPGVERKLFPHPHPRTPVDNGPPDGICTHLEVSWQAYVAIINELVRQVARLDPLPDFVIGLTLGGVLAARAIHKQLRDRVRGVGYGSVESYGHMPSDPLHGRVDPALVDVEFNHRFLSTAEFRGRRVLVVDSRPGTTLTNFADWIRYGSGHGFDGPKVMTAALWSHDGATTQPDMSVDTIVPLDLDPLFSDTDPTKRLRQLPLVMRPEQTLWLPGSLDRIRARDRAWGKHDGPVWTWPGINLEPDRQPDGSWVMKMVVPWEPFAHLVDRALVQVADLDPRPNHAVGVLFGGWPLAYAISRVLRCAEHPLPLALLGAERYSSGTGGVDEMQGGQVRTSRLLLNTEPGFGVWPMVCDDLLDKGDTMTGAVKALNNLPNFGHALRRRGRIRTCVLLQKSHAEVKADVCVATMPPYQDSQDPRFSEPRPAWVVWPWESGLENPEANSL